MSKWHLKDNGEPGKCEADKGNCPKLKEDPNSPHFEAPEEAQAYSEELHASKYGKTASLSKSDRDNIENMTLSELTNARDKAVAEKDYVKANQLTSAINDKMINDKGVGRNVRRIELNDNAKKTIAIDLDDTVGSFSDDVRIAFAKLDGITYEEALERYPVQSDTGMGVAGWFDDGSGDFGKAGGIFYKKFREAEEAGLLYHNQPVRTLASEVVNELNNKHKVIFLTARPEVTDSGVSVHNATKQWLRNAVGVDFDFELHHETKKETFKNFDILIDDSPSQVNNVSEGGRKVVAMVLPENSPRIAERDNVYRASGWADVAEMFDLDVKALKRK